MGYVVPELLQALEMHREHNCGLNKVSPQRRTSSGSSSRALFSPYLWPCVICAHQPPLRVRYGYSLIPHTVCPCDSQIKGESHPLDRAGQGFLITERGRVLWLLLYSSLCR